METKDSTEAGGCQGVMGGLGNICLVRGKLARVLEYWHLGWGGELTQLVTLVTFGGAAVNLSLTWILRAGFKFWES